MKKLLIKISIILIIATLVSFHRVNPAYAQDYPLPPSNPDTQWQPPYETGGSNEPNVIIETYEQIWPSLQIPAPSVTAPGIPSSIISAYFVNGNGQIVNSLYRNSTCYLIASFDGSGYFYLWEYYPTGSTVYGHWLCYRWYCPHAGVWRIGPFIPDTLDPAGKYIWKLWFLSGNSWSTRSLSFHFTGNYYPPDIPGLTPVSASSPIINSFNTDKASIEIGETAILSWSTSNTQGVTISPDIGAVALSGTTSVTPTKITTYTLTAKGQKGNPVTLSTTITVTPHVLPNISISELTINKWQSTLLSWSAPSATKLFITDIGDVANKGAIQISPKETTTYTLTATYLDGIEQSTSVTVNVKQYTYLFWGLIALLALAVLLILILLIWKRARRRQKAITNSSTSYGRHSEATDYGNALPATTPLIEAIPAKLIMPDGKEMLLAGNSRSLGRQDLEEFLSQDQITYISRQHLNITYENGQYFIEDNSSTNGTMLNNNNIKGIGRLALSDGDTIELAGKLRINFKQNTNKEV